MFAATVTTLTSYIANKAGGEMHGKCYLWRRKNVIQVSRQVTRPITRTCDVTSRLTQRKVRPLLTVCMRVVDGSLPACLQLLHNMVRYSNQ